MSSLALVGCQFRRGTTLNSKPGGYGEKNLFAIEIAVSSLMQWVCGCISSKESTVCKWFLIYIYIYIYISKLYIYIYIYIYGICQLWKNMDLFLDLFTGLGKFIWKTTNCPCCSYPLYHDTNIILGKETVLHNLRLVLLQESFLSSLFYGISTFVR